MCIFLSVNSLGNPEPTSFLPLNCVMIQSLGTSKRPCAWSLALAISLYMSKTQATAQSSRHGAAETNPTRNHEAVGSILDLAQWVEDPGSCELWCRLQMWARIQHCCGSGTRWPGNLHMPRVQPKKKKKMSHCSCRAAAPSPPTASRAQGGDQAWGALALRRLREQVFS